MKGKHIIKLVAGIMVVVMSFYGTLPVGAATYDAESLVTSHVTSSNQESESGEAQNRLDIIEPETSNESNQETVLDTETSANETSKPDEETSTDEASKPDEETSTDEASKPDEETSTDEAS